MSYAELVASLAEPSTRRQVAATLRKALPASCDALLDGLANGQPSVRRWSAVVLDHAPHDERIEQALRAAAKDRNRKVRRAALHDLSCGRCKPDGCLSTDGIAFLVDGMLHDRSSAVRRTCAGNLMFGQHGRDDRISDAFRAMLANDTDPVLRRRAAIYLASGDVPRHERPYGEWVREWQRRIAELLAA